MFGLIGTVFSWIVGLFTKSTRDDEVALGRSEQQIAEEKADMAVIQRTNKAAKSVPADEAQNDPNNLDRAP